jgi:hypothetical protein
MNSPRAAAVLDLSAVADAVRGDAGAALHTGLDSREEL